MDKQHKNRIDYHNTGTVAGGVRSNWSDFSQAYHRHYQSWLRVGGH